MKRRKEPVHRCTISRYRSQIDEIFNEAKLLYEDVQIVRNYKGFSDPENSVLRDTLRRCIDKSFAYFVYSRVTRFQKITLYLYPEKDTVGFKNRCETLFKNIILNAHYSEEKGGYEGVMKEINRIRRTIQDKLDKEYATSLDASPEEDRIT